MESFKSISFILDQYKTLFEFLKRHKRMLGQMNKRIGHCLGHGIDEVEKKIFVQE